MLKKNEMKKKKKRQTFPGITHIKLYSVPSKTLSSKVTSKAEDQLSFIHIVFSRVIFSFFSPTPAFSEFFYFFTLSGSKLVAPQQAGRGTTLIFVDSAYLCKGIFFECGLKNVSDWLISVNPRIPVNGP